ncbi:unnamed protein product [Schistosoma spindalis]|nr:unnamed protein product [Schistosoma spindale]
MIHRIIWISWKLFIISISLHLFSLNLVKSENNNSIIEENGDHNNSSHHQGIQYADTHEASVGNSDTHEILDGNYDSNGFPLEVRLNQTSIEIKEELQRELEQFQRMLDELTRRIKAITNSANKYMINVLFIIICMLSFNLFIYV